MTDDSSINKCFKDLCKNIETTYDLKTNEIYNVNTTKLNELRIMGSYASYSSSGSHYSTSSLNQLRKNICLHNRFIHLDVDFKIEEGKSIPVVKGINELKDVLDFDECCKCISATAWCIEKMSEYPLFLYLNLKYDEYFKNVSNRIANSLIKHFSDKWPDMKYKNGFQLPDNTYGNLALEPLSNFMGKVIILTNYDTETDKKTDKTKEAKPRNNGSYLNELIHSYVKISDNLLDVKNTQNNYFFGLNYNNVTLNSDTLSGNENGNPKDYKLDNKFIVAFPNYKNNKKVIYRLYNFNIQDDILKRFNAVLNIYKPLKKDNKKYKYIEWYLKSFRLLDQLAPIKPLLNN